MSKPIRQLIAMAAAGAAAITLGTLPAEAAARTEPSVSFFPGAEGKAHWSVEQSNPDSGDKHSMKLEVPFFDLATEPINFAGIDLHHEEGRPAPARSAFVRLLLHGHRPEPGLTPAGHQVQ